MGFACYSVHLFSQIQTAAAAAVDEKLVSLFLKCCPPSCYFKLDPLEDQNVRFLKTPSQWDNVAAAYGKMQIIYIYMPIITVYIPASCASLGPPRRWRRIQPVN